VSPPPRPLPSYSKGCHRRVARAPSIVRTKADLGFPSCVYSPVRTFDTACTYFHKFRLNFRDAEYNYQDAALASLFVACKVEDTIKKSRDILAAAYNVKNPDKTVAPDDKVRTSRPAAAGPCFV